MIRCPNAMDRNMGVRCLFAAPYGVPREQVAARLKAAPESFDDGASVARLLSAALGSVVLFGDEWARWLDVGADVSGLLGPESRDRFEVAEALL